MYVPARELQECTGQLLQLYLQKKNERAAHCTCVYTQKQCNLHVCNKLPRVATTSIKTFILPLRKAIHFIMLGVMLERLYRRKAYCTALHSAITS